MDPILWLSGADVAATGVCDLEQTAGIVQEAFRLYDGGQAVIAPEAALRLHGAGQDRACYSLPAYVGGQVGVCGLKWSAHGGAAKPGQSRIHAAVVLNDPDSGRPLAVLNGTEIGAARTGAVTAAALSRLAPAGARKAALCGAGGQAERQLQALLLALPGLEKISIWSRGGVRSRLLADRYAVSGTAVQAADTLEAAVEGADVVIAATSASSPYLTARHLESVSLYCHIGFHEIAFEAVDRFDSIVVDAWEEARAVSGQSLFRYWRERLLPEERITGKLGAIVSGALAVPRAAPGRRVMFDAFGLPIFDLSVAKAAYLRAREMGLGTSLPW